MKKWTLLFISIFCFVSFSQGQSKKDKARTLIRDKFKETMNDYKSYEPVHYSKIDSLFYSPFEDKEFVEKYVYPLLEIKSKIDIPSLEITTDVSPIIEKIKKKIDEEPYNSQMYDLYHNLMEFDNQQYIMNLVINSKKPDFIGWKMTHKFRAKNVYNATVLNKYEFRFDKNMTKIIDYKPIDE